MSEESGTGQQQPWTQEARDNVLAALSAVREFRGGTEEYGPEFGQAEALGWFRDRIPELGNSNDADGLARVAIGLVRLSDMLLDWIQNEADNKKTLLADVRKKHPGYEEPDTYPTHPNWSTWVHVLLAIEKSVGDSPTAD